MEWTREQRYLPYDHYTAVDLLKLEKQANESPAQLRYHIRPASGLLNDPNGFSYFNGEWNVFYQAFPFGAVHGLKSWYRLKSTDLVHWQPVGLTVFPDTKMESHGAYSGSARAIGDQLFLMYTGNHRDADDQRIPYQVGAWLSKDGSLEKLTQPLIEKPAEYSEHFRDPQLMKHDGHYYALIGAQTTDKQGRMVLFEAPAVTGPWTKVNEVQGLRDDLGYMVECPNLVDVDGVPTLIFCPQGMAKDELDYQNIYPNVYQQGADFDWATATLTGAQPMANLDEGFDVYASQAFNAPDGTAYLISWVGLPDLSYPTDEENWANCLSQVKELHQVNGHLVQQPVAAMKSLRQAAHDFSGEITTIAPDAGQQMEVELDIAAGQTGTLHLAASDDLTHSIQLHFDTEAGKLVVDRTTAGQPVATDYGTTREIAVAAGEALHLRIFLDHSLAEIFVNHGEQVATLRYFADQSHGKLAFDAPTKAAGTWWHLVR